MADIWPRRSVRDQVRLRRSRLLRLAAYREREAQPWPGGGRDLHDLESMIRFPVQRPAPEAG